MGLGGRKEVLPDAFMGPWLTRKPRTMRVKTKTVIPGTAGNDSRRTPGSIDRMLLRAVSMDPGVRRDDGLEAWS
jgi:hypothetical protein